MDDQRTNREGGGIVRNIVSYAIVPGVLLFAVYDHGNRALAEQSYGQAAMSIFYAIVVVSYSWSQHHKPSHNRLNPTH